MEKQQSGRNMDVLFLILCSAIPIVSFLEYNSTEVIIDYKRGLWYFVILFAFSGLTCLFLKRINGKLSLHALSFAVGIVILLIFHVFLIHNWFIDRLGSEYRMRYFLGFIACLLGFVFWLSYRLSHYSIIRNFTTAFMFSYVAIFLVLLIEPILQNSTAKSQKISTKPQLTNNVYYIIPDMMLGPEAYQEFYQKDLSLISYLESQNFKINRPAYSNAPVTLLSLAHVFNMDYLFKASTRLTRSDFRRLGSILRGNNPVIQTFKAMGYKIIYLSDGYVSFCSGMEDVCIQKSSVFTNQDIAFLNRTQFITLLQYLKNNKSEKMLYPQAWEIEDFIDKIPFQTQEKTFTILHIGLPHYPFRFQSDCSPYLGDALGHGENKLQVYHDQMQCSEQKYKTLINQIVEKDKNSLILVQSDHGTPLHNQGFKPNLELTDLELKENFNIVSAYRLPKQCDHLYSAPLSPVNSFKLIFACLTQKPFQVLPHHSFVGYYYNWPAGKEPVQLFDPYQESAENSNEKEIA